MRSPDERRIEEREQMLKAMGIQPWYLRRAPAPPATPQPTAPAAEKTVQSLQFSWVAGATGMMLCELGMSSEVSRLARDVVAYGDWLRGASSTYAQGDFQWPQLVDSGGTPQRALQVFVDKHLSGQDPSQRWLAITAEVADQLEDWRDQIPARLVELPGMRAMLGDASSKKAIWQAMSGA